jgi:Xaa-Pro aminopeptidase
MPGPAAKTILIGFILLQASIVRSYDNSAFAARRESLMNRIGDSVAVLEGAPDTRAYTEFRQDNNFYYLTGAEVPNALLLIDGIQRRCVLFLPPRDLETEHWEGPSLFAGPEARMETGIDEVLEISRFGEELDRRKNRLRILYVPLSPEETAATSRDRASDHDAARGRDIWDGRISREAAFEKSLKSRLGDSVSVKDLSPILDDMRRLKDAQEIGCLREAGRISALGMKEAMRAAGPGIYEFQVAAAAEFIFSWRGAQGPAFFPIVGSGPNSCLVHYNKNKRKMEAGEIVLMDFGADYRYYQSDITRTFPVSGKFSEEQARIYRIVLDAQKAALEKVRPGATFDSLRNAAREVLERHGYADFMTHAVSHYIGMSTHDVGESIPFEPGVVITVEPGVYMPDKNLGIRIEDTVLVTRNGYEILTGEVPKEIAEIEKLMSEKGMAEAIPD